MNSKIRLLAVASLVAIMASGCSSYRGANQASTNPPAGGYSNSSSSQVAGSGQVARGGGFGQQRSRNAVVNDSCAVCAASKAQSTYTYKPAKPAAPAPVVQTKPAPRAPAQTGQYNQQYYIDRWNRQQAAAAQKPAPRPVQAQTNTTNYAGYGTTAPSNTTYYDYSTAARSNTTQAPASNATSNKSIYTGSYQQNTYTPTTYAGGSSATTNTGSAYQQAKANIASNTGGGSSYTVKKGDTVFEIMRQTGVYWKDIISMNNLQAPYNINPGQTLRLK